MADVDLKQSEASDLIAMEKYRIDDTPWNYPALGGRVTIPLTSHDRSESFLLDLRRGRIDLYKGTYQNRGRQVVILARLDFGGAPHRNPDGVEIPSPHLHIYREGYGDKWAIPVPQEHFTNTNDLWKTLKDFMTYCNVVDPPRIQPGLFT